MDEGGIRKFEIYLGTFALQVLLLHYCLVTIEEASCLVNLNRQSGKNYEEFAMFKRPDPWQT